ncbi:hypothetical protein K7W03_23480 [Sphingobium sp. PNB]|uniref:hypothetical protein n=1 Tax=Sphingobium sp. PNB TaxID=863934 RepID=UPI001CA3E5C8|nr:hypothetical protein [Sphingobium sp. PNB]MCB4862557.1 hypothetical protein [Sphingobium sp. PNB]
MTHNQARRLLQSLDVDDQTRQSLTQYINSQEKGPPDFDSLTDREHSIRASNRAVEAISRVATLQSDLDDAQERIAQLEDNQRSLATVLEAVLAMLDGDSL